jgi:hypothetical protein
MQRTSETLETYACNMHFSPFFRMTRSRVENGRFRLADDRGWWHGLAAWPATPAPGLCPASDGPLSLLPGHTRRPGACAVAAGLVLPASSTDEQLDPGDGEESCQLGGGGHGKQVARVRQWRTPRGGVGKYRIV